MPYNKIKVSVLYLLIFRVIYATKDSDFLQNSSSFQTEFRLKDYRNQYIIITVIYYISVISANIQFAQIPRNTRRLLVSSII